MTDVVFAFGPTDNYLFASPSKWAMKDLPEELRSLLCAPTIAYIYHVVLGANGSFYIGYCDQDGQCQLLGHDLPDALHAWLMVQDQEGCCIRNISKLRISLGPNNDSFWASDEEYFIWDNLPPSLNIAIDKLLDPNGGWTSAPRLVVLGVKDSYVLITARNGGSWNVTAEYPLLDEELDGYLAASQGQGGAFSPVHHISLDPHNSHNFVLVTTQGFVGCHVPDPWDNDFQPVINSIPKTPTPPVPVAVLPPTTHPTVVPRAAVLPSPARPGPIRAAAKSVKRGHELRNRILTAAAGAVVKGVVKGVIFGITGQITDDSSSNDYSSGGGDGGDFYSAPTDVGFQSSMSQSMWDPVQQAASSPIQ